MRGSHLAIAVRRVAITRRARQGQRECGQRIKLLLHDCHLRQIRHRKQMLARGALVHILALHGHVPLDMDSCWRLPWSLFNESIRDYWHVSKFPVVRAPGWPTSPQHHLQVTIVSTTKDQALSGVRHGCRDSVGRPTGSAGGKRDFLAFWLVRISTAVRLPAMSIRQEHTSRVVAILTQ